MGVQTVGLHHISNGAALLGDLQFAIAISTLEGDMQVGEQILLLLVLETQFFREDQRATRNQRLADIGQQGGTLFAGNELQREVQRHQGGGLKLQLENVRLDYLDRQQLLEHRILPMQVFAA